MAQLPLFTYGTLQVSSIIERITGQCFASEAATLHGYTAWKVRGESFPAIHDDPMGSTPGRLYNGLEARHYVLLDAYEGQLYLRHEVEIETGHGRVQAWVYRIDPRYLDYLSDEPWHLDLFIRDDLNRYMDSL